MSTENPYNVTCKGCDKPYYEEIFNEIRSLFHFGTKPGDPSQVLPTAQCVYSYDYVLFTPCKHCCPESFADCPDCIYILGKPTTKRCNCPEPPALSPLKTTHADVFNTSKTAGQY